LAFRLFPLFLRKIKINHNMKKIISLVFTVVLSLAVLNVMAIDKNSKKVKTNKKLKTVKNLNQFKTPDREVKQSKAITIADLKKIKQKAA